MSALKNIEKSKAVHYSALVEYQKGQIVSRTLIQNGAVSMTLFAFDEGEEISTHSSHGDAIVQILEGTGKIVIGDEEFILSGGETIVMPAEIPHAVFAVEQFKMLLTVIF